MALLGALIGGHGLHDSVTGAGVPRAPGEAALVLLEQHESTRFFEVLPQPAFHLRPVPIDDGSAADVARRREPLQPSGGVVAFRFQLLEQGLLQRVFGNADLEGDVPQVVEVDLAGACCLGRILLVLDLDRPAEDAFRQRAAERVEPGGELFAGGSLTGAAGCELLDHRAALCQAGVRCGSGAAERYRYHRALFASGGPMTIEADYRLPRTVVPHHYALALTPDLDSARFTGCVTVDLAVDSAVSEVVLNAAELQIEGAELVSAEGRRVPGTTELDAERERLVVHPEETLTAGKWKLHVDFSGILNDQLRGFYRSTYTSDEGEERVLATTQFEATDARRAFPCWDEPDLKATFDVTLVVPDGMVAVSCGPIVSEEALGDGTRRVSFATTMKLSTYLLAFVVGELEATPPVDVDGTPLRIIHVPGKEDLTGFALECGAFALGFFADYYGIAYPGDKLDLLAIPDFASGAMENLGAVTSRESLLLIDPEQATQAELQRVADVIAHELAHMWFGDLVTMRWWNGLWLKEAFATFMEMVCVDAFRPDWRRWASFAAERDLSMDTDALESTRPIEFAVASPEEADAMYDVITYRKGAAVLRMLQQYLGEEVFRSGISRYLRDHAYGNTETHDLWSALEAVSGEPVGAIMESWIFQGGHPQVEVVEGPGGYTLRQERFRFIGDSAEQWMVPVLYRTADGAQRLVLTSDRELPPGEELFINRGGDGYYRTQYVGALQGRIAAQLGGLDPEERFVVVSDAWANTLAGDTDAGSFLELVATLAGERDVWVWGAMFDGLRELNRVVSSDDRPSLQAFVQSLTSPTARRMGWRPQPGESDLDRKLRGEVLGARGVLGSESATIAESRRLLDDVVGGAPGLDGEVAAAALGIAAAHGDMSDHVRFAEAYAATGSPQDRLRYLGALAAIPEATAARETLAMVLDGRIRSQNAMFVVARLIANRVVGPSAWQAVKENWDELIALMPPFSARNVITTVHLRSEPELAADIASWLTSHPLPGGGTLMTQQLERLDVRVRLRRRAARIRIPGLTDRRESP